MKDSLKKRLLSYLERNYPRQISSGDLQRLALEAGYFASNASRRLRELEVEGKILVSYGDKNAASYQFRPPMSMPTLVPINKPLFTPSKQNTLI